ncbi:hypothetical protein D3C86_1530480 [compost metagenome]
MNIELKQSSGFLSVKELRYFLDAHEAMWTEQDEEFLGKFEDQKILSLPPKSGYTFSKIHEALGYGGFFIIPTDQNGEEIND